MMQQILRLMEQELYDEAFQTVQLNKENTSNTKKDTDEFQIVENILRIRTNLSSRINFDLGMSLSEVETQNSFIRGEIALLKGMLCFEQDMMELGTKYFEKAISYFNESNSMQRELIANFNFYVGQTFIHEISTYQSMSQLSYLESKARECQNMKLLGLIIRQKSLVYKQLGKFQAAFEEAKVAIPLLEYYGTQEELFSGLINASQLALELNQTESALSFFNEVENIFNTKMKMNFILVKGSQTHQEYEKLRTAIKNKNI